MYYSKHLDIRFNCTVVKGINSEENDILDIIYFAKSISASVKFIELLCETQEDERNFVSLNEIEKILLNSNYKIRENSLLQKIYYKENVVIVLAKIVCSVSKELKTAIPHCITTNNIFLAADGTVKPCMKNSFELDMLQEIKNRDIINFSQKMEIFFDTVSILCPYQIEGGI